MIVPSIDLREGRAVQLRQGRELLLTDERDPVELAAQMGRYGPLAVVDLDAALGRGDNREVIEACCRVASCRVGGGIRTREDVLAWIRKGAAKVVIGTRAESGFLGQFPAEWIVAALDARGEEVVTHGWTERSGRSIFDQAREIAPFASEILFTQVEREGMLGGSDVETALELRRVVELPITVAGGIRTVEEVVRLHRLGLNSQLGRALYEGRIDLTEAWIARVVFDARGLVPTVVRDVETGDVLMVAYSSAASLERALRRGEGWYWSRSRDSLWRKGETSGHTQELVRAALDCDADTLLFEVRQRGPACHRGTDTCFGDATRRGLLTLERVIASRRSNGDRSSYTSRLLADPRLLAAKLREEVEEVIEARTPDHLAWECADLLYHLMVRMREGGVELDRVEAELASRSRPRHADDPGRR